MDKCDQCGFLATEIETICDKCVEAIEADAVYNINKLSELGKAQARIKALEGLRSLLREYIDDRNKDPHRYAGFDVIGDIDAYLVDFEVQDAQEGDNG